MSDENESAEPNDVFRQLWADLGVAEDQRAPFGGAYKSILAEYDKQTLTAPRLDPAKVAKLLKALAPDGVLVWELKGQPLNWISGLSAFCRQVDNDHIIAGLNASHSDVCLELYRFASKQVDSVALGPTYDQSASCETARKRGALLIPDLPIPDRELLTDDFINAVLRPYHAARRRAVEIYFRQIEETHRAGMWLAFRTTSTNNQVLLLPGKGFDQLSNYRIPRASYARGFGYHDDELDQLIFPPRPLAFDPEALVFLPTSDIPEFCLDEKKEARKRAGRSGGRPKGTGFKEADLPAIEEMHELMANGWAKSVRDAARQLVERRSEDVAGEGTEESTLTRLRKRYREMYPSNG
ncbi:hypothetical protein SAMN05421688_3109 [Poseidonocella pacifica]|uniref:Uncharacterized protein n=1 Tax=Poseidonocella pacifica TaxID=871651 RepID=A0A1I0YHP9_9RHOB|nr:hypothetical protein [Poseidonocella pacifica]SFB12854.1 hypothetical protein SAMN05421688_3109 [Poseidonocella pacifica]